MITIDNYHNYIKGINLPALPEPLRELHDFINEVSHSGKDWTAYKTTPEIKETIDSYFDKLKAYTSEDLGAAEVRNTYTDIYNKLLKVIPGLDTYLKSGKSSIYVKSKIESAGIMPLVVESRGHDKKGNPLISLAHYYKQNGDLMSDPFMEIRVFPDLKMAEAISFEQSYPPLYREVYVEREGKELVNLKEKKSQNSFLLQWLRNIISQGHLIELSRSVSKDERHDIEDVNEPQVKISGIKTSREAAKDLIRTYVLRGESYEQLKAGQAGAHTGIYSARIVKDKIVVAELRGKKVYDNFSLKKIYNEILEEAGKPVSKTKPKSEKVKEMKVEKPAIEKVKKEPTPPKIEGKLVERLSDEVKFISQYLNLVGKNKTDKQLGNFIDRLQGAIYEKRIGKKSPFADEIRFVQDTVVRAYNNMLKEKKKNKPLEALIKDIQPAKWESRLKKAVLSEMQMLSITFLKRFKNMDGTKATKEKAESLKKAMERAAKITKRITEKDKYIDALQEAYKSLDSFISGKTKTLEIHKAELNGIESLINSGKSVTGLGSTDIFSPINNLSAVNTFRLPGPIGKLLGDLERNRLMITLEGDQGGGKTQLYFQIADAFADMGYKTGIFSLEIGKLSSTLQRFRQEHIKPLNYSLINIADTVPNGIETIREYARLFDVVVIDSWTKLNIKSEELDKLIREFPNTMWIIVFQRTSGKQIRGGTRPLFDAGINIEVIKVDDTFKNNYAVVTKNRYGDTGVKYNIIRKAFINE